jgi:hypothetical protein
MKIIVSRYNEDISWTKDLSNVCIINKGNDQVITEHEVMNYDNVGREGHTYYKYIVDNYDSLDEYFVFLQGYPFDHSPNIMHNLEVVKNYLLEHKESFCYLSENVIPTNLAGDPHFREGYLPMKEVYYYLFNEKKTNLDIMFGAGAQFMVSRELIMRRPKEFYQKIVDLLGYHSNPVEGHVIERFHRLIFAPDVKN